MAITIKTTGLLLLLPFLLTACFDNKCKDTYLMVPLHAEYSSWFSKSEVGTGYVKKTAQASTGLQETLTIGQLHNELPILQQPGNCSYITGKVYGLRYHASVYGNNISVMLMQQNEGELPVLKIDTYSYTTDFQDQSELLYDLSGRNQYPVTYNRTSKKTSVTEQIPTNTLPEISVVDSLPAGNRVYRQVYKITNPYLQKAGNAFSITAFYVDKAYGLVQYAQQDGTVWQLQL